MVGVPGRSKSCGTCRRRKKGCDLQRPVCGQCQTGKIACTGWNRSRVFVNATAANHNAATRYAITPPKDDVTFHNSLSASAYGERYLEMFLDIYLPGGRAAEGELLANYATGTWTSLASLLYTQHVAVKNALLAHCLASVGKKDDQQWMMYESLKFHGAALRAVRLGLSQPEGCKNEAMIIASRALSSYQINFGQDASHSMLQSNQAQSWQAYNLGDEALIIERSPSLHMDGVGHRLFVDGRMQLVFSACMRRKRSFLSEEAWKTVPWTKYPKTSKDLLLDVVVDVPALLEKCDILASTPTLAGFKDLTELYNVVDKGLVAWYREAAPLVHMYGLLDRGLENATAGDYAVVEIMTIYWTMCLLAHIALQHSLRHCSDISGIESYMDQVDEWLSRIEPRQYCNRIIEIVGIFFQPSAGILYSKSAAFPIGVTLGFLMNTDGLRSKDAQRLLGLFSRGPQGNTMGKFIKSTVSEWGPNFGGPRSPGSRGTKSDTVS